MLGSTLGIYTVLGIQGTYWYLVPSRYPSARLGDKGQHHRNTSSRARFWDPTHNMRCLPAQTAPVYLLS